MANPAFTVLTVGREREPVLVVDDFTANPDSLLKAAVNATFGPARNHYPGIRAPLPATYLEEQLAILGDMQRKVFGGTSAEVIDASFSIVTTPPGELSIRQRLPHCDAFDAGRIALVHYLAAEDRAGTAFFRHRSTGFETIDDTRAPLFFDQLDAEIRYGAVPPAQYIRGDTALFEMTAQVEGRYNRAVLYRSKLLHSGAITEDVMLSPDPQIGRLTVTGFLSIAADMAAL